jgi:hypothetical protein
MATREVAEWEKTDAANNFPADEGGWKEGMNRSDVNNAARANMGAVRRWYEDPEWLDLTVGATVSRTSDTEVTVIGDYASYFTDGKRVKLTGGSTDPWYATVDGDSAPAAPNTLVTLKNFSSGTAVPASPDPTAIFLNIISGASFEDPFFVTVPILTGAAIQEAIKEVEDAGGGTILLTPGATYIVETTILAAYYAEPGGAVGGNFRIMGQGATLFAHADLESEIMIIGHNLGTGISANIILDNVIFNGNSSQQSFTGDGMVSIPENVSYVRFVNCFFGDSIGPMLYMDNIENCWIDACVFDGCSRDSIKIVDPNSSNTSVYIRGCRFNDFGRDVSPSAGIYAAGQISISDCTFSDMNEFSNIQVGILLDQKLAASPIDQSGHNCTITNCYFSGTGVNARGIDCQGRDNTISNCTFMMSSGGTEGVLIRQSGSGVADNNIVTGCLFNDQNRGVEIEPDGEDNVITGNRFANCTYPYTDSGKRNKFSVNHIMNCTDGITIGSTAEDPVLSMNTIDTSSNDGIVIATGATRTQSYLDYIRNATGVEITDDGTQSTIFAVTETFHQILNPIAGAHTTVDAKPRNAEVEIPDTLVEFDEFADGTNVFATLNDTVIVKVKFTLLTNDNGFTVRLRMGPNRLINPTSDAQLAIDDTQTSGTSTPVTFTMNLVPIPTIVPNAGNGDEMYLTIERTGGVDPNEHETQIVGEDTIGGGTYIDMYIRPEK